MLYIKLINEAPVSYTIAQLRQDNPDTSFPSNPSLTMLAEYNVFELKRKAQPQYNQLKETIRSLVPVLIDGQWTQQWEVVALPEEQQLENLEEARATAYREESDPLFFKCQRGELDKQVWLDKVAEIKARFPKDN